MGERKEIILEKSTGHRLRMVNVAVDKFFHRQNLDGPVLPKGQGPICGYLMTHQDHPVFQKDIEHAFHISGATASTSLKNMEANGYIQRIPLPEDGRMKQIVLTEKGKAVHENFLRCIANMETAILKNFTPEEKQQLAGMLERMAKNLLEDLNGDDPNKEHD